MNFINTGMDERILKSMDIENPSEELIKAMSKQGLVQKDVQVKGKNGQTFTRKQWVKAGADQKSDKTPAKQDNSGTISSYKGKTQAEMRVLFDGKTATDVQKEKGRIFREMGSPSGSGTEAYKKFNEATSPLSQLISETINNGTGRTSGDYATLMNTSVVKASAEDKKSQKSDTNDTNPDKTFDDYVIQWVNNGTHYLEFDTFEDLKAGLKDKGLPLSLANFKPTKKDKEDNSYTSNDYQNYKVLAYFRDEPSTKTVPKKSNIDKEIPKDILDRLTHDGDPSVAKESYHNGYRIKVSYSGKIQVYDKDKEVLSTYSKNQAYDVIKDKSKDDRLDVLDQITKITGNEKLTNVAKKHNISWENSSNDTINETRAGFAMVAAIKSGKLSLDDLKTPDKNPKSKPKDMDFTKISDTELKNMSELNLMNMSDAGKRHDTKAYEYFVDRQTEINIELGKRQKNKTVPQPSGQKLSKEDAKKKTQSFTSKVGKTDAERNDFMSRAKAQGITWKEKNDNGTEVSVAINWMRCCMAMNSHFANGGDFK